VGRQERPVRRRLIAGDGPARRGLVAGDPCLGLHAFGALTQKIHGQRGPPAIGDLEDVIISNGIGELVSYLVQHGKNVDAGLSTATHFRGNRMSILSPKMEEKFVRFSLPYDEYLENMEHLKSFSFDFVLCGPDWKKALKDIIKNTDPHKDIIYQPHPQSRYSTGNKLQESQGCIDAYKEKYKGKVKDLDNISMWSSTKEKEEQGKTSS